MRKLITFLTLLVVVGNDGLDGVYGASDCGSFTVQRAAWKLGTCELATKARNIDVPVKCCNLVRSMAQNPRCLCTVALSETARKVGVLPHIALDVVKRCGVSNRPVGSNLYLALKIEDDE
ncbi:hypothetical protein L484_010376 [Morus notabilis]|uniref:Bifunctional inhibitor/plant lipid transfer protein/seed storage helical domain-containing protein n=1 Tax=Morus notabilis TaxID=981085 RepID=W9RZI7_9ROSA|nr:hypothetical protein L484_010376 [Morus notabilis]